MGFNWRRKMWLVKCIPVLLSHKLSKNSLVFKKKSKYVNKTTNVNISMF